MWGQDLQVFLRLHLVLGGVTVIRFRSEVKCLSQENVWYELCELNTFTLHFSIFCKFPTNELLF